MVKQQRIPFTEPYLDIDASYAVDDSVAEINEVVINPTNSDVINNGVEIRFINTDPGTFDRLSQSYIQMKGTIASSTAVAYTAATHAGFVNNGPLFLFERAVLKLGTGNFIVEDIREPGISSLMTAMAGYDGPHEEFYFVPDTTTDTNSAGHKARLKILTDNTLGTFDVIIPLSHIFGFCRTYDKVLQGTIKELTLTRRGETDAVFHADANPDAKVTLTSINWVVPRIYPSIDVLGDLYAKIKRPYEYMIPYTCHYLTKFTMPTGNMAHRLNAGTLGGDNSRVVAALVAFQTAKEGDQKKNNSVFDHCSVEKLTIELGGQKFPFADVEYNFARGEYTHAFKNLIDFKKHLDPEGRVNLVRHSTFASLYPIFAFDLSKQKEKADNRMQVMEIVMRFKEAIPANTNCYVLTFADKFISYQTDGSNIALV